MILIVSKRSEKEYLLVLWNVRIICKTGYGFDSDLFLYLIHTCNIILCHPTTLKYTIKYICALQQTILCYTTLHHTILYYTIPLITLTYVTLLLFPSLSVPFKVLKIRGATGQNRVGATSCCYTPNGKHVLPCF